MDALLEAIRETLAVEGVKPRQTEGTVASGWVLVDYGDVVVHIFSPKVREYYRLEQVWSEATTIVRVQ